MNASHLVPRVLLFSFASVLSACTHAVALEAPSKPEASNPAPIAATTIVPSDSAQKKVTVRSAAAGMGNKWEVDIGKSMVDYADAYVDPLFPEGDDVAITLELLHYDVQGFAAQLQVQCTVVRGEETLFDQTYEAQGSSKAGGAIMGGAFAMKGALRQTTREALTDAFGRIRQDLQAEAAAWSGGEATGSEPTEMPEAADEAEGAAAPTEG